MLVMLSHVKKFFECKSSPFPFIGQESFPLWEAGPVTALTNRMRWEQLLGISEAWP